MGSALVLEFLLYYMVKPEYQICVREEVYLDNMLDLFLMYNAFYTTHKAKLFIKKCEESKLRSLRKRRGFFFLYDLV